MQPSPAPAFQGHPGWVQMLALSFISYVTLGKHFPFLGLRCAVCKMVITVVSTLNAFRGSHMQTSLSDSGCCNGYHCHYHHHQVRGTKTGLQQSISIPTDSREAAQPKIRFSRSFIFLLSCLPGAFSARWPNHVPSVGQQ